jgi:Molecular chaperone (small heat shock protein)
MEPKPFSMFFSGGSGTGTVWQPAVDIYSARDGGWILKFELAGVRPEDINISVQGCRVQVAGVRRDWLVEEGATHFSMEIAYSRFQRSVELPCELDQARWTIEFKNGILLVRLSVDGGRTS